MPDDLRPRSMADLPVQTPLNPASAAGRTRPLLQHRQCLHDRGAPGARPQLHRRTGPRARPGDADRLHRLRPVPPARLRLPATAPFLLARYARIRAGETLDARFTASGAIHYVIAGRGHTDCAGEVFAWTAGDVFILPGGAAHQHHADGADAVLWVVTNEPFLALEHLQPPAEGTAPTRAVHYPAAEIGRQMALIDTAGGVESGHAVMFSSEDTEHDRTILPMLTPGDEHAAAGSDATAASAQFGRGLPGHCGGGLSFDRRWPAQGLDALRDHGHAAHLATFPYQ